MEKRNCKFCNKEFEVIPSNPKQYCSKECVRMVKDIIDIHTEKMHCMIN
jgi:hypothetical protein